MSDHDGRDLLARWAGWWWMRVPSASRRIWPGLAAALADGLYLCAFRRLAVLCPAASFALGLVVGGFHLGFRDVFSESLPVMAIAATLGILSGNLGVAFLIGFGLGDFFLAHGEWATDAGFAGTVAFLVAVRVPLLIQYGLLSYLVLGVSSNARSLSARFLPPARLGWRLQLAVQSAARITFAVTFVYFWTHAVPFLMRPVFTWRGQAPTTDMAQPLQLHGMLLVYVVAGVSLVRIALEIYTRLRKDLAQRLDAVCSPLTSPQTRTPVGARFGPWPPTVLRAAVATLMLAGILDYTFEWIPMFAAMLMIGGARAGLIPVPLGRWPDLVDRVWLPLRLVAILGLIYALSYLLLRNFASASDFSPMVLSTALSLVAAYLLIPSHKGAAGVRSAPAAPGGAATIGLWAILLNAVLWLVLRPDSVFADHCGTPSDCSTTPQTGTLAGTGIALLVGSGSGALDTGTIYAGPSIEADRGQATRIPSWAFDHQRNPFWPRFIDPNTNKYMVDPDTGRVIDLRTVETSQTSVDRAWDRLTGELKTAERGDINPPPPSPRIIP